MKCEWKTQPISKFSKNRLQNWEPQCRHEGLRRGARNVATAASRIAPAVADRRQGKHQGTGSGRPAVTDPHPRRRRGPKGRSAAEKSYFLFGEKWHAPAVGPHLFWQFSIIAGARDTSRANLPLVLPTGAGGLIRVRGRGLSVNFG